MPYSSGGRPATAFSPMLGISRPSYAQTSLPSSFLTTRGATSTYSAGRRPSNMCGRLDDMVVDAHQDHVVETHALPLVRD